MNDIYFTKEPGVEGEWYNIVKVIDGHMELVDYLRTREEAEAYVRSIKGEHN